MLDTSVLLSDPWSLTRFDEHEVVLPLVVISELEGKRHHPELGWFARTALRMLDELRIEHGRLDAPVPIGTAGGTLHVELNHTDPEVLPAGFRTDSNDSRILACALNLAAERRLDGRGEVVLVTKDMPLRVKAAAVGLQADEYHALDVVPSGWTGMTDLEVDHRRRRRPVPRRRHRPRGRPRPALQHGFAARPAADRRRWAGSPPTSASGSSAATGRRSGCTGAPPSSGWLWTCCSTRRSASSPSAAGPAPGSRRSPCAPGWRRCWSASSTARWWSSARSTPSAGRSSGYLPGSESEKMSPWAQAVFDTLGALVSQDVMDEIMARGMLEVLPLTHIRGRSLHDTFVIVDEAQSLERNVLLTVLSRLGTASRVVLTHDVAQRDNLRVGRHDGVAAVIEKLKGHPLFAHVTLTRSERSPDRGAGHGDAGGSDRLTVPPAFAGKPRSRNGIA